MAADGQIPLLFLFFWDKTHSNGHLFSRKLFEGGTFLNCLGSLSVWHRYGPEIVVKWLN